MKKWLRRLGFSLAVLVLAGWGFAAFLLPGILERVLTHVLRERGFTVHGLEVRQVSLREAELIDLDVEAEMTVRIPSLWVRYTPRDLLVGRVSVIDIRGAVLGFDTTKEQAGQPGLAWPGTRVPINRLPFDQVTCSSARIQVRKPDREISIPLDASLNTTGETRMTFHVEASLDGNPVHIGGTAERTGDQVVLSLALDDVGLPAMLSLVPNVQSLSCTKGTVGGTLILKQPKDNDKPVTFEAGLHASGGGNWNDKAFHFKQVSSSFSGTLSPTLLPEEVAATLIAEEVRVERIRMGKVRLSGTTRAFTEGAVQASIPELAVQERSLAPLSAGLSWSMEGAQVLLQWPPLHDVHLVITRGQEGINGRSITLGLSKTTFRLDSTDPWAEWLREATDIQGQGTFSVHGTVMAGAGRLTPHVQLTSHDARLVRGDLAIEGIHASITVTNIQPLRTLQHQQVNIDQLTYGELSLSEGYIAFGLGEDNSVNITDMRWTWAGGTIMAEPIEFPLKASQLQATLACEHVAVSNILSLVMGDRVRGTGRLNGRLPVTLRWAPKPGIAFGKGYLEAVPRTGTFEVKNRSTVEELLQQSLRSRAPDDELQQLKDRIILAFQDFEYTALRLDFVQGKGSRPAGTLDIQGQGRKKDDVPIRLTVKFALNKL